MHPRARLFLLFTLAALPAAARAAATCGNLNMVWRDAANAVLRSEPYTCGTDACAGYRCVVGSEISPACYDQAQCAAACSGQCVDIPSAQLDCAAMCAAQPVLPAATPSPAPAQATFGALSNFDVFNDTGQDCHGFEIELDGVTSQDVLATFGEPYERYGNPKVEDFPGGVYVRYESAWDPMNQVFTQATPQAPAVITATDGHACWSGGSVDYLTKGCEHFGVALNGNPTATVYRWLVADPLTPGALQPSGTKVSIPAPIWNVSPPPVGAPDQVHPVVAAVIEADPPEAFEFGDAKWVKVFKTEAPEPAELHHLVTDDPSVPQEQGETEIEWALLQTSIKKPARLENEAQIGEGNESVTRRYEFYEYTGPYDPESHEAMPVSDSAPSEGEVGNYLGSQMAAINLPPADATPTPTDTPPDATPTPTPPAVCGGDCSGDGVVTINELVSGVNIALGNAAVDVCSACDGDGDGGVSISELVSAVQHLLNGCA